MTKKNENSEESIEVRESSRMVTVLNRSLHPRTIDLGPLNSKSPALRRVLKVPPGVFSKKSHTIVPGRAEVELELWMAVRKHPVGMKLIERDVLGIVEG